MTITVSTADPRSVKALAILADSGQWLKLRTRDGRKFYGVRSQASPDTIYAVDCYGCDCPDFLKRLECGRASLPCKHVLAVQLHCARVNGRKAQLEAARQRRALTDRQRANAAEYRAIFAPEEASATYGAGH